MVRSVSLIAVVVAVVILGCVAVDRGIGLLQRKDEPLGLLFPPYAKAVYETAEFKFTAAINQLGFRDREFSIAKGADYRIIAIGDSFTYGWGVELGQAWPKVLERNLLGNGSHVEIANLGRPGAGPRDYAETAEKAIPLLKPDLVIVAVLQGDDLWQSRPQPTKPEDTSIPRPSVRASTARMLHRVFPNLTRIAKVVKEGIERDHPRIARLIPGLEPKTISITSEWKSQQQKLLDTFTPEEKARFERLPERIKQLFMSGKLSPGRIKWPIKFPGYFLDTFDLSKPDVQNMIDEMAKQLGRIRRVADQYTARVVVVSVPFLTYVSPIGFKTWREYGFLLDESMLVSDSPDQAIWLACQKAGLPFFAVTHSFRKHNEVHFFYDLDGHFDASGDQFYADQLTPIVDQIIKDHQGRRRS